MRLRPIIFWSHLVVGVLTGLVILLMSATGVLLTYERQLVEWAEQSYADPGRADQVRLSADQILEPFRRAHPDEHHFYLRAVNRAGAAVPVWAGDRAYLVDPWTGDVLREGQGMIGEFLDFVTRLHRWLALDGSAAFGLAQAVTAYSNLLFLFLIGTGIYLWLPRVWRWPMLKPKILFNPRVDNARARDFNWHHVFSFWSLIPLFLIVLSATIFYFSWAVAALYGTFGEEVPVRAQSDSPVVLEAGAISYEALLDRARAHAEANGASDWYSIWMELGEAEGEAEFYIDRSIGHRPSFAYSLRLDVDNGEVLEVKRHDDWSRGDQAWDVLRFLHTGEIFGFVGQTVAGLASLAACLLVYTGLALAWRRLISPLFAGRASR